jgi:hypothetical protein
VGSTVRRDKREQQRTPAEIELQPELGSFAGEFRPMAQQKRFRRSRELVDGDDVAADTEAAPPAKPRRAERERAQSIHVVAAEQPAAASAFSRLESVRSSLNEVARDSLPAGDPYSPTVEISRIAERLIEARERLAVERARADRAERDLRSTNERVMAARMLVHEAQRTAQLAADRATYLEGRCEALQDALDMAVNASLITRWRWRRAASRRSDAVVD